MLIDRVRYQFLMALRNQVLRVFEQLPDLQKCVLMEHDGPRSQAFHKCLDRLDPGSPIGEVYMVKAVQAFDEAFYLMGVDPNQDMDENLR